MVKDIAVFVGQNGATASFYEKGNIVVYRKKQGYWTKFREKEFTLAGSHGMKELRGRMTEALSFLENCKVFVGLTVVGVPYFELEKAKCSIWEFEGNPEEFLEYILEQEEGNQLSSDGQQGAPVEVTPQEFSAGYFRISLKDIQNNNLGITSKQALLPFLQSGEFYQLEVFCDHVPPWLEAEFISSNLNGTIVRGDEGVTVKITKKCCDC